MKRTFAILSTVAAVTSTAAQAETKRYEYFGLPFVCDNPADFSCTSSNLQPFSGTLSINKDLLPGNTLADATIKLTYELPFNPVPPFDPTDPPVFSYDVSSTAGTYTGVATSPNPSWPVFEFDFIDYTGIVDSVLFGAIAGSTSFTWTFNEKEQIVEWLGDAGLQGGSNDFQTTTNGDFYAFPAQSLAPGIWANVPLPMPVALLFTALATLGLANRKRSA